MDFDVSSVLSLVSKIHSSSAEFLRGALSEFGLSELSNSHGNILFTLSKNGESLCMGELSQRINRDKSTTTALVKKLEKSNLVRLERDKDDFRKRRVFLTEKGRLYNDATAKISAALLENAWRGFSADEKNTLVRLLLKMSENL